MTTVMMQCMNWHHRIFRSAVSSVGLAHTPCCCHEIQCPSPLSEVSVLSPAHPPPTVVCGTGARVVLQPGHHWLQPPRRTEMQDSQTANQGVCGKSSQPNRGEMHGWTTRCTSLCWKFYCSAHTLTLQSIINWRSLFNRYDTSPLLI